MMAEAQTAHAASEEKQTVETGSDAALLVSGTEDLSMKASPSAANSTPQSAENVSRGKNDTLQSLRSSAANDDFIALDAHLKLLKQHGSRQPEMRALVATLLVALAIGGLLAKSGLWSSSPVTLASAFFSAVTLFFVITTALRQRMTQVTLTTLLRTTSHLAQPDVVERQRLAIVPEHFKAELAALDRSIARTSQNAGETIGAMTAKLHSYEESLSSVNLKFERSFEKMSIERAAIVTNGENLRHALVRVSSDISKDLASVAGNLQSLFQAKTEGLVEVVDQRNRAFIQQYLEAEQKTATGFKQLLDQALVKSVDRHEGTNERFLIAMARRQEDFDGKLDRHMREAFAKAEHQISGLSTKTESIATSASRQVEDLLSRAETATEERSTALRTMLASTIIELSQSFKRNTESLEGTVETSVSQIESLAGKCRDAGTGLAMQVEDFKTAIVEPLNHLSQAFGEKSRAIASDIVVEVTSFNDTIALAASQVVASCEREKKRLGESSDESIVQIRAVTDRLLAECASSLTRYSEATESSPSQVSAPYQLAQSDRVTSEILIEDQELGDDRAGVSLETTLAPAANFAERYRPSSHSQSWISELLARTDAAGLFDQVALTPSQSIETIQNILVHIDSLVATDKAIRAWNLFKEDNVADFDDVFTQEGKDAVAMLKIRIDNDAALHSFVENYLKKVEALVKEAYAETDEDALLSYMSSSNGKTYTLLAYVIERI